MARPSRWLAVALAGVLALGVGCSDDGSGPGSATFTPLVEPTWQPVTDADEVAATPAPLPTTADLDAAEVAATAGADRSLGEHFALQVAQVVTDVRHGVAGADVLARVGSPALPEGVRAYLINEIDSQQEAGTRRHLDTSLSLWIRSRAVTAGGSSRLEVEVAGVLVSDPMAFRKWHRDRYVVARDGARWSLVDYAGGGFGPSGSAELTPAQRRDFLPGKGWRRIPPA